MIELSFKGHATIKGMRHGHTGTLQIDRGDAKGVRKSDTVPPEAGNGGPNK